MDLEMREINRRSEQFSAGDNSRSSETAIAIGGDESADSDANSNGSATDESVREDEDAKKVEDDDKQRSSCVIDIDGRDFVGEYHRVCRICHLSARESGKIPIELMELGCGCKGELGVAHSRCAEAWFRVRGNRLCEICGETAKNITGVDDAGFLQDWNESTAAADTLTTSSGGNRRRLRGQPLCNFLMACLVIAFVLPWFFRVNMI